LHWWHRLSSLGQGSRLIVHSLERLCHQPTSGFPVIRVGYMAHERLFRKVFCRVRSPHHLMAGNGGQCPPYTSLHHLRVGHTAHEELP
jgi:hypothetical protein